MGLNLVYYLAGKHELAQAFNKKLRELQEERDALEEKLRAEAEEAFKTFEPWYRYVPLGNLTPDYKAQRRWLRDLPDDSVAFRIFCDNRPKYLALLERYGSGPHKIIDDNTETVTYYRINGVVVHMGGGQMIFADEHPVVSDEEWNLIKTGQIPAQLLR